MQWKPNEFSKLTKVSVRTLHHYDDISLLKPSARLANGYRLYSETDLQKLERIVALKFFGFGLKQIKVLVNNDQDVVSSLKDQQRCLDGQIEQLNQAREAINQILATSKASREVEWQSIAKLIEVFRMTKKLQESWAGKVYTQEQLQKFAEFGQEFPEKERIGIENRWKALYAEVEKHLHEDPAGPAGKKLAKVYNELMQEMKKAWAPQPELWKAIGKAYDKGKMPEEAFPKKIREWLEKAAKA